jgi:hypothetical protein
LGGGQGRLCAAVLFFLFSAMAAGFGSAAPAEADEPWRLESVGVYGGAEPEGDEDYRQVEGVFNFSTPLVWERKGALRFAVQIQAAAGAAWTSDKTAFTGGAGPRFFLSYGSLPLWLEIGSRAGWITKDRFGGDDLGGAFQFASHAAIGFKVQRFRIGARMQHTSNAGIYSENDGYNILGGVVEYGF